MGDDTTTAPERIWAYRTDIVGAVETGIWADTIRHMGGVEYIRADLCRAPDAVARLVEAALQVSLAYQGANPMRTADVHRPGCGCLRCAVDQLDCAALAQKGGE